MRGLTLLEVLIVVAIISILGVAGVCYYRNYGKDVEVISVAHRLISDVRSARSRAIAGESQRRWGVHAVNGAQDYYQIFSTPTNYADATTTIDSTVYLSAGITFSDPADSATKDILFSGIAGTTTATTTSLSSQTQNVTITITGSGTVY